MSTVPPFSDKPLPFDPVPPSRTPLVTFLLVGCGAITLGCMLLCGGLAFWGYRYGMQQIDEFSREFEQQGYDRQTGQVIQVGLAPERKTVFVCQVLKVTQDVGVDIAILSQMAEIDATVHGDVDFVGQVLQVHRGGVIEGDLRVRNAQVVEIDGKVTGTVSGSYMVLRYQGKSYGAGQSPKPASAKTPFETRPIPEAPQSPEAPSLPREAPSLPPEAPAAAERNG